MPETPREFVLPTEAARELRKSRQSIYRWIREGRLPAYQVGDSVRIDRADLDAFIRPFPTSSAS